MSRKREQAQLFFELGQLFGPLLKIMENPSSFDSDERTRILARFSHDMWAFVEHFSKFTKSEPGHDYQAQLHLIQNQQGVIPNTVGRVATGEFDEGRLFQTMTTAHKVFFEALYSIPVPVESAIHEAHSPFSTYCLVRDLCSTARQQVVWMDRYFDQTVFGRYFVDVPKTTEVILVTWPETKCTSNRDRQRYADFMGVSKLFAQERGTTGYRLITDEHFHDRWLHCDDRMFNLGGSIKDLGNEATFTITKLDTKPENSRYFDEAIARGTEVFGPSQPTHP